METCISFNPNLSEGFERMNYTAANEPLSRRAVFAGLAVALLGTALPAPAFGDTQSDLDAARAQLESIGKDYRNIQAKIDALSASIVDTNNKIQETSDSLKKSQAVLAQLAADGYKGGDINLTDVLFSSKSLSDVISGVFYMGRVSEAKAKAVEDVKTYKAQLEEQEASQQKDMDAAQKRLAEQGENQQKAQALVNSLDAQVKAEIEAEAARNAAVQAAMQSASDATAQETVATPAAPAASQNTGSSSSNGGTGSSSGNGGTAQSTQPSTSENNVPTQPATPSQPASKPSNNGNANSGSTSNSGSSNSGSSTGSSHTGSSALAVALQFEGTPYVYGGNQPGGFDCSGLVQYAYKQLGISLPRTDGEQLSYVRAHGRFVTSQSQLQYGDLAFFPGHVAFYVGDGKIFGARKPGTPASTTYMKYFGTFLGGGQI